MIFIYNSLFIISLGFFLRNRINKKRIKKFFLILCFFQMFLIQGLRSIDVGTDTSFYVNVYNNFLNSEYYSYLFTHYEIGFQKLYMVLRFLNADSQVLLLVVSAITMLGFGIFIYKNSTDVVLSTFIFSCMFYPNSFNIMRQYLAIAIVINSLTLIFNRKYITASIIIAIGTLFHSMAIVFFIPLILYLFKNWKLSMKILLFSSVVFFLFGNSIINFTADLFNKNFYAAEMFESNRLFRMTTFVTFIFCCILLYCSTKKNGEYREELKLLTCLAIINFDFGILYLKYEFMSRMIEMFNTFLLMSFPIVTNQVKSYYRPLIKAIVWIGPFLLLFNSIFNSGSGVEEYRLFFMK